MRRGQAALEYLVTYGWAFLALLVVLGALAYFGFLSPQRYLPVRCDFGAQLECTDFQIWTPDAAAGWQNGIVRLQFRNSFGDDINVTGFWVDGIEADAYHANPTTFVPYHGATLCNARGGGIPTEEITIPQGNVSQEFRVRMCLDNPTLITKGERYSLRVTVQFHRDQPGSPEHNVSGEIFGTATEYAS